MDSIAVALREFSNMTDYKYLFQIAYKKQIYELTLSFDLKDFSHMAGLHYLKDIDIPGPHWGLTLERKNTETQEF